jgi:ATP-dependent Clp protease ATP-binding subunit ClpA
MKTLLAALPLLLAARAFAGDVTAADAAADTADTAVHRYLIERSFPAGALDGLDEAAKARVNANNASVGVSWIKSFANADRTKTYCVYEGPSEDAIRQAAALNNLPVDSITEVPVDLTP